MSQNFIQYGRIRPFTANQVVCPQASAGKPQAGDPCVVGQLPMIAETSAASAADTFTAWLVGVHKISVEGKDGGGNSAVAVGDKLYIDPAAGAHQAVVSKLATGVYFGIALGTVVAGATTQIEVLLARAA